MATIVGAIASSHTPTIGFALDTKKQSDPNWAPIFEGYEPVRQWLAAKKPDVLFLIFNDHITLFFFDHYSHFALGVGDSYPVADEGGGPRRLPPVKGHPELAAHIASGLVADEFDLSFFQGKGLDHGCFSPLSVLWPDEVPATYLERINKETKGVETIEGTYPFTLDTSVRAYRLNRFLHDLIIPEHRRKFLADPETTFDEAGLTEKERAMVRNRDWREMIHYGVIFFMLEKLGAVVGTSNLHIYAAMRGQSLEDFQKTRNAQVLYSVAGRDEGKTDWDNKNRN
jgi:protocatechuate 4,5-dioxygenase alpha subunit